MGVVFICVFNRNIINKIFSKEALLLSLYSIIFYRYSLLKIARTIHSLFLHDSVKCWDKQRFLHYNTLHCFNMLRSPIQTPRDEHARFRLTSMIKTGTRKLVNIFFRGGGGDQLIYTLHSDTMTRI